MIKEFEFFHGAVLSKLIREEKFCDTLTKFNSESNSSFIFNEQIGIYIKYSTKRMSPWNFTFMKAHQDEIREMKKSLSEVFVVLVCNDDGIVCLSYSELKKVLDENHEDVEWISASRKNGGMYSIKGKDGELPKKIAVNDFPNKLFAVIKKTPTAKQKKLLF